MKVNVHYLAQVRQAAGRAVEQVELEQPCTVRELIARQAGRGSEALRRLLLDEQGRVQPSLLVFVGDEQVSPDGGRALRDGEVITVLSPMAGG